MTLMGTKIKIFIDILFHKILCFFGKHDYRHDEVFQETLQYPVKSYVSYCDCNYCPKFVFVFDRPTPDSYLEIAIKQRQIFEYNSKVIERKVLVEKTEKFVLALETLMRELNKL